MALNGLLDDSVSLLDLDRGAEILCHLLTGNADEIRGKIEAQVRFECNVDLLLGSSIDNALVIVEFEAVV